VLIYIFDLFYLFKPLPCASVGVPSSRPQKCQMAQQQSWQKYCCP